MLYIVRSIPGSGKTTFANKVFPEIVKFDINMFFMKNEKYCYDSEKMQDAIAWCISNVENCLKHELDICISGEFLRKTDIDVFKEIAEKFKIDFKVYTMMGNFCNIHGISSDDINLIKNNLENYSNEIYVYPNLNQSENDPCYRPYLFTNLKIGDKIKVDRFADHKKIHTLKIDADGKKSGDLFEMEKCVATITKIQQGTYDYLNIHYVEDDNNESGICFVGDCQKI